MTLKFFSKVQICSTPQVVTMTPKWVRVFLLCLLILVAAPVISIGSHLILLSFGYCPQSKSFLSKEEHIRIAIKELLRRYQSLVYVYDKAPAPGHFIVKYSSNASLASKSSDKDIFKRVSSEQLVEYKSVDEFLRINPDCCSFSDEAHYGVYAPYSGVNFGDNIMGGKAGYVNIKYRVRFYGADGNLQYKWQFESSQRSNCGIPIY